MPRKASKLLQKMRNSSAGWKRADIIALYEGYGFVISTGSNRGAKHDKIAHPEFPQLVTFLPRHTELARAYVREAVRLVSQLIALTEGTGAESDEH